MTKGEDSDILTAADLTAGTDFYFPERQTPFRHYALSSWITDHKRLLHGWQLGSIHQITHFFLIHRRTDDHVRHTTHVCNVIGTVVGRAVFSDNTGTVQAKYYR